ncbi:DUF2924 domain-containing protein [Candidatus Avelusimicrobium fimicolum]|uniref:DUF2924 domain-containing protein n=1 Tax=Candidatus Avelusimicrobium fimicolum TaxID=3416216 RepID=UPI003D0B0A68
MQNYTHLTARELEHKWLELIGRPIPPIGRSLIIKYLLWYEQARREKISPLGFFYEVKQAAHNASTRPKATLEIGSKLIRSYCGVKYEVEIIAQGYLYKHKTYKSLSGVAKAITGKSWNGNIFFGVKK